MSKGIEVGDVFEAAEPTKVVLKTVEAVTEGKVSLPQDIKMGDTFEAGGQTWKVTGLGRATGGDIGVVAQTEKGQKVVFSPEYVKQIINERGNKMETKQDYEFVVKRSKLVKLYGLLGFKTADKWDCKKFEKKVKSLPDFIGQEGIEFENEKAQKFVDGVLAALEEGKTIVVVDEIGDIDSQEPEPEAQEVETKKESEVAKPKKKTKAVKTKTKEKASEKVSAKKKTENTKTVNKVERDVFGSCVGSNLARVNACLSKKPKTMGELVKQVGLKDSYYTHLGKLVEAGLVKKSEGGYSLK